jgi:hypothetical protein
MSGCSSINVLLLSWTLLFSFFTTNPVSRHAPYNVEYFPQYPFQARFSPKFSVTLTDKLLTGVRICFLPGRSKRALLHAHTSGSD